MIVIMYNNLKIDYRVRFLTNTEAAAYLYIIKMITDHQQVNRGYLAKCLNITDLERISDLIKAIAKVGLINLSYRRDKMGKQWYSITLNYKSYYLLNRSFLKSKSPAYVKGIAIKLRCAAFSDTLDIKMNWNDLASFIRVPLWQLKQVITKIGLLMKNCFYRNYRKTVVTPLSYLAGRIGRIATWITKNIPTPYQHRFYNSILSGRLKLHSQNKIKCVYNF